MGDDIQPFPLIVEAQCRATAQARHLCFSKYCLEAKIKAVGTVWFPLIHDPNGKTEGEGKEGYVLQTQPSKQGFSSAPSKERRYKHVWKWDKTLNKEAESL